MKSGTKTWPKVRLCSTEPLVWLTLTRLGHCKLGGNCRSLHGKCGRFAAIIGASLIPISSLSTEDRMRTSGWLTVVLLVTAPSAADPTDRRPPTDGEAKILAALGEPTAADFQKRPSGRLSKLSGGST